MAVKKRESEKEDDEEEKEEKARSEDDEDKEEKDAESIDAKPVGGDDEEDKKKKKDEERTVDLVFSTGAGVVRRDDEGNQYLEVLSLDPSAVRLGRLNSGAAPLLNSHSQEGLDSILGVIQKAWIDPVNGEARAKVRFSKRSDVDPILQDVKDKIIVSTSVGYTVHGYQDITKPTDSMPVRLVTDWEPLEISLVSCPADEHSRVRKKLNKSVEMKVMNTNTNLIQQERNRGLEIRKSVAAAKLETSFADNLIERGIDLNEARKLIIDEFSKGTGQVNIQPHSKIEAGVDESDTKKRGIEQAILNRINPTKNKLEPLAHPYYGKSLLELAKDSTRSFVNDRDFTSNSPLRIIERAFNSSSSDFPAILANVVNKQLREGFESAPATFYNFCRKISVKDFKPLYRPQLGEAPLLEKVQEHGEYRRDGLSETNQTYSINEWGKILSIPMRMIIDDDLNAFSRIPSLMGRAAQDHLSEQFYQLLCSNPLLSDGPLFDKEKHKNIATNASGISIESLSDSRTALRQQTGQAGRVLNLQPKYLLVPSTLETKAEQFLSQNLLAGLIKATSEQMINPFAGKLELIVEPRLDAYSKTGWYQTASVDQIDLAEIAFLNGAEGPAIISRDGFDVSGIEWRINYFYGFGFLEYRSWYFNPGK